MTPGIRTKSTRALKSKLPMIGDPERIKTDRFLRCATSECNTAAAPEVAQTKGVVTIDQNARAFVASWHRHNSARREWN